MFETSKIKKILSRFPGAEESEKQDLLDRLAKFGGAPIPLVVEELRYNRLLYADAQKIFQKLFKKDYLEIFINGLGESKENIKELFKETIITLGKSAAVPALVENLANEDHMVRKMAGELIIELADASIAPKIIPFVRHESKDIKKTAMDVLSSIKSDKATDAILPLLDDSDSWIRRKAVEALCRLKDKSVLPRLLEIAQKDNDPFTIKAVLDAVTEIGDTGNTSALLEFVKNPDLVIRQKATDALTSAGDSTIVPDVMQLLREEDVNIRRAAVDILNGLKDPKTASALVKAVKDSDWWVREIATDALGDLGGGKINEMIMELLNDEDEYVRRCAVEFFCRIKNPDALNPLIGLLGDPDWWVREKAITALGLICDPKAIEHIAKLVNDQEVVWAIPKALAKIGTAAALNPLASLLKEGQKQVRLEALRAVGEIEDEKSLSLIKAMALDKELEIKNEALKILRDKTGRTWLVDDVLEDMTKSGVKNPLSMGASRVEAKVGDLMIEAILVVDLCKSTDTASSYGDHAVFEMMNELNGIIQPLAKEAGMRFVKSTGDGLLMTFDSVRDATGVASRVLDLVATRNASVDKKRALNLRFAINVGETRLDGNGDRLGNSVNMTFRLEGVQRKQMVTAPDEAKPDQMSEINRVLLTDAAQNELLDDSKYQMCLIGFFELKGISGLHKVYQLVRVQNG